MGVKNIEFKAKVKSLSSIEKKIVKLGAIFKGEFKQVDTYYNVPKARLKLRETAGEESSLIYYNRENIVGHRESNVIYYKHAPSQELMSILELQFGIKVKVNKVRKIYKLNNINLHIDDVDSLGTFVEVEAGKEKGMDDEHLSKQCDELFTALGLRKSDLVAVSYSDLVLNESEI